MFASLISEPYNIAHTASSMAGSFFLFCSLITVLVAVIFLVFQKRTFAVLSMFILFGAGYSFWYIAYTTPSLAFLNQESEVQGLVYKVSRGITSQSISVSLVSHQGNIRVILPRHPEVYYGDTLLLTGLIRSPQEEAQNYYRKERLSGIMRFPEAHILSRGGGIFLKRGLFAIKDFSLSSFRSVFALDRAALMSGLTLGDISEMTQTFRDRMSLTGTTHLVALSGYNVLIIARGIFVLLGLWFSRRKRFWFSVFVIVLFVVMTGAEASVVRAGIMAILLLLADHVYRAYRFRNAIIVAGFLMVVANPLVLVFDVGFQLSFAALLGLVYLEPVLRQSLPLREEPGLLGWRDHLRATLSAQLMVLPILLSNFGSFSPLSILVNVLVLVVVPLTMLLGLCIILASLFSSFFALVIGFVADIFLRYIISIIDLFSRFSFPLTLTSVSLLGVFVYYVGIIYFIVSYRALLRHA